MILLAMLSGFIVAIALTFICAVMADPVNPEWYYDWSQEQR